MSFVVALAGNSLRRFRTLLLTTGIILAGFQLLLVEVGAYLDRSGSFSGFVTMLPAFVRQMMGESLFAFLSFSGVASLGYFHIAVLSALTAMVIVLGTEPAAEVESGFADLVMAKALGRHVPVTRTVFVLLISVIILLAMMMIGTLVGLKLLAPAGAVFSMKALCFLVANLAALLLCWGGIALLASAFARRRASAAMFAGMIALIALLLDYLGRLWKPAGDFAQLSPFRHYGGLEIVQSSTFPARDTSILLAVAVVTTVGAYAVYARRDL